MKTSIGKILSYLFVGALWGITNPFLKQGAQSPNERGEGKVAGEESNNIFNLQWIVNSLKKFLKPSVFFPILINQLGSLSFYFLLATDDISIAVPLCNSLTFAFTGLTGWFLGERIHQPALFILGIFFILCGIYLCVLF